MALYVIGILSESGLLDCPNRNKEVHMKKKAKTNVVVLAKAGIDLIRAIGASIVAVPLST